MVKIRIIGDVHGKIELRGKDRSYKSLIETAGFSVQLGDLGFDYRALDGVDPCRHRVIAGNHDNYGALTKHFLGDFGNHSFPLKTKAFQFFFIRGGCSVDRSRRTEGVYWWPEEELNVCQSAEAVKMYTDTAPEIVLSHDCPDEVLPFFRTSISKFAPSRTNILLSRLLDKHRPKLWFFGHHHRTYRLERQGTTFICLGELAYFDFDARGKQKHEMPV